MGITRGQLVAAQIQKARVLDVNVATYTVTIATEFAKKPMTSISFATPYQHFINGEGIYFMPEVGSLCWLCVPSDGCMPFILAWASGQDEADFTARKRQLNPGDIFLGTRDENFLILRRGGVVQIGADAICQRIFLPVNNTIKDFCENYGLHTLGGDLEWSIKREENKADGKRPATLKLYAKEFANDPKPIAELEIGSQPGSQETILSLAVYDKGADGRQQKITLAMTKDGDVHWQVTRDVTLRIDGKLTAEVGGVADVHFADNVKAKVDGDLEVNVLGNTTMKAQETTIDSELSKTTGVLEVAGKVPVALATPLIAWLSGHFHQLTTVTPGSFTTPSTMPTTGIASQKLFSS